MCAVSCLAEFPQYISNLFITQEVQENGLYRLRICKNGVWQIVTIDDYFPCDTSTGTPVFSRANGNEIWVLLIEKAMAKLHQSYCALIGGDTSEALIDLSGAPCTNFDLVEDHHVKNLIANGQLWNLLRDYDRRKFLISASTAEKQEDCHSSLVK